MKKKRWLYRNYRSPRTTQERRSNGSRKDRNKEDSDYGLVRAKRTRHNLPNVYDDIPYSYQKSWKKRRKQRYRLAGERRKKRIEYFWYLLRPKKGDFQYDWAEYHRYRRVYDELQLSGVYFKSEYINNRRKRGYKITWFDK